MRDGLQTKLRYLILSLLLLASLSYAASPAVASAPEGVPSVVIQKRRTVLIRRGKFVRDFPERKRAIVSYPVIAGPQNSPVLRKVRALFDFKNIFDTSLAEYRENTWLSEFDYKVNYNRNFILDITFMQDGIGAYPDTHTKHFAINLRNGELIKAADAFNSSSLDTLAALVDKKLQTENQETIRDSGDDRETAKDLLKDLKFQASNLDEFSIGDKGITFLYDAGFPHMVQALQPVGKYFFSFAELKSYIRRDGPLGIFVR
ncbi:MAG: hypothetical protein H0U54_16860 [Acidobacteria bacterium]|nr:hypothetical protein [Acidobacteriota bacterium]